MRYKSLLLLGIALLTWSGVAMYAEQSTSIPYHGRLTNSSGQPFTSTVLVQFRVCKGGTATSTCVVPDQVVCAPPAIAVTPDSNGNFDQNIGPCSPLALQTTDPLFLDITLDGFDALQPRQLIVLGQGISTGNVFGLSSVVAPITRGTKNLGRVEVPAGSDPSGFGEQVLTLNEQAPAGNSINGSFVIPNHQSGLLLIDGGTGGNITHIFKIYAIGTSATDNSVINISNANTTSGGNAADVAVSVSNNSDFTHTIAVTMKNLTAGPLNLDLRVFWIKIG